MKSGITQRLIVALFLLGAFIVAWVIVDGRRFRVVGQPEAIGYVQSGIEQPFFQRLSQRSGLSIRVDYRPADATLVADPNRLAALKSGDVEIVSLRFPESVRQEPSFLAADLPGLYPDFQAAREGASKHSGAIDEALHTRWNSRLLGLWAIGPQVIMCRKPVKVLRDIKGLRVRVSGEAMAGLMLSLGAIPARLKFQEVSLALKEGLVDCAISSLTSARTDGWFLHLQHALNITLQFGLNGYAISEAAWDKLSHAEQAAFRRAFDNHLELLWMHAEDAYRTELACASPSADCAPRRGGRIEIHEATAADVEWLRRYSKAIQAPETPPHEGYGPSGPQGHVPPREEKKASPRQITLMSTFPLGVPIRVQR
jgi:TRAP-type C4-dicarboxylate transport system substrate-binding protein